MGSKELGLQAHTDLCCYPRRAGNRRVRVSFSKLRLLGFSGGSLQSDTLGAAPCRTSLPQSLLFMIRITAFLDPIPAPCCIVCYRLFGSVPELSCVVDAR